MSNEWTKGLPTEPGVYWLYSYRYGRVSYGVPCDPELQLATVHGLPNGIIIVTDGQIVSGCEVESPMFKLAALPDLPDLDNE
jgi:hypothetical protein